VTYSGRRDADITAASAANNFASSSAIVLPPEGNNPEAGKSLAALPLAAGTTEDQVLQGQRVFVGTDGGSCGGCHGADGSGSPIGADLTKGKWLWTDGSLGSIKNTILSGVPNPKVHLGAMPPKGGVNLSDADVDALTAYVWAISRNKS
jgi:mono/diheme cytochrome c family protein